MRIHNFSDETITKLNHTKNMAIVLLRGIIIGAVAVALILDGRGKAMWEAFNNPKGINTPTYTMKLVEKK